jgi:hypothetical protein
MLRTSYFLTHFIGGFTAMNQAIYEHLVPKLSKGTDRVIQIGLTILITILVMGTLFVGPISFIIGVALGVVSYYFIFPRLDVEYEYTLVNHQLDIDIIYKKSKRKSLISLDLKDAQIIAPAKSHRLDSYQNAKTVDYSSQDPSHTPYAVMISMKQVMNRILIQPDDAMVELMRNSMPRTVFKD